MKNERNIFSSLFFSILGQTLLALISCSAEKNNLRISRAAGSIFWIQSKSAGFFLMQRLSYFPMCLILFAYRRHPKYPLVLIANRDEYYARPTQDAHWWSNSDAALSTDNLSHKILGGRDSQAGGSWLAVNRQGRFAAVTNVREPCITAQPARSRGELPVGFLNSCESAQAYLEKVAAKSSDYAGFNLLIGDGEALWFYSNREDKIWPLDAGVYGICNGRFDEAWPKLSCGKQELEAILSGEFDTDQLMSILRDEKLAADSDLPQTGVELKTERLLSSRFIRSGEYGTRASSIILMDSAGGLEFTEQNYSVSGQPDSFIREQFLIAQS